MNLVWIKMVSQSPDARVPYIFPNSLLNWLSKKNDEIYSIANLSNIKKRKKDILMQILKYDTILIYFFFP